MLQNKARELGDLIKDYIYKNQANTQDRLHSYQTNVSIKDIRINITNRSHQYI